MGSGELAAGAGVSKQIENPLGGAQMKWTETLSEACRGVYVTFAFSVHSESVFCGAFVWARRVLNSQKTVVSGPGSDATSGRNYYVNTQTQETTWSSRGASGGGVRGFA
jgi:hypothetical protein